MSSLFALASFLSAALLFFVQPLTGQLILPLLGSSPSVWVACLVFFQVVLLLGYLYAHALTRLSPKVQVLIQLGLLALGFAVLPISVPETVAVSSERPSMWVLGLLISLVGLPFFGLSAHAPLLAHWLGSARKETGDRAYSLYVASNWGSFLILFAYPTLITRTFTLNHQSLFWTVGYGILFAMVAFCAYPVLRAKVSVDELPSAVDRPSWKKRGHWLFLAAVPSGLLSAVTFYITSDVGSVPVFWLLPLGLYLLSFALAFSTRGSRFCQGLSYLRAPLAIAAAIFLVLGATEPFLFLVSLHLCYLFVASCLLHSELFLQKPSPQHLTQFYLWVSLGGAVGGCFSALVAPLFFKSAFEYPLLLILSMWVAPSRWTQASQVRHFRWKEVSLLASLAALVLWGLSIDFFEKASLLGVLLLVTYLFWRNVPTFATSFSLLLLAGYFGAAPEQKILYRERSFFGLHRVAVTGEFTELFHGNTLHGRQAGHSACEPLSYFHASGPAGDVFRFVDRPEKASVAVVGLGAGSLACYARREEQWTFYEIDPAVKRIATNPRYFSYLQNSKAHSLDIILGDARLKLGAARDAEYSLLLLDAFSSDAIPTHLLTKEAFDLYFKKLAPQGVIALHISNRHFNLLKPLARFCEQANLFCLSREMDGLSEEERAAGKDPSDWIVFTHSSSAWQTLLSHGGWHVPPVDPGARAWTDDFTDVLAILRRRDR